VTPARWGNRGAAHGAELNCRGFLGGSKQISLAGLGDRARREINRRSEMKIVEAVNSVELHWYNQRWNLFLCGDDQARKEIESSLIYDRFGRVYLAQSEGLISYCYAGSGGACGGSFTMRDGSVEEVTGAWSGNPGSAFKDTGVDFVDISFNGLVISLSIEALRVLGYRFGFVIHETADAYRYNTDPIPEVKKITLANRIGN
jgi:hypothetical protein